VKIYTFDGKLVEEVGGAYSRVVFLNVLKDEDKDKCPHCGKPIPTEIVSVVSSPNHEQKARPVETLKDDEQ
jgi:hypothetical protein